MEFYIHFTYSYIYIICSSSLFSSPQLSPGGLPGAEGRGALRWLVPSPGGGRALENVEPCCPIPEFPVVSLSSGVQLSRQSSGVLRPWPKAKVPWKGL